MDLKVGTFNILNTSCRYPERQPHISQVLSSVSCDIWGIQEVNLSGNSSVLSLPTYTLEFIPLPSPHLKSEPEFRIDGNAILLHNTIEVLDHYSLTFSNNLRVCQFLKLRKAGHTFIFGNTHLDHLSDVTRTVQTNELIEFIQQFDLPLILTGDFNFVPESAPYERLAGTMRSSFKEANGREAAMTFPTGLLGDYADLEQHGAFDYIWLRGKVEAKRCGVVDKCGEGSVWASDHYPVFAEIRLTN